MTAPNNTPSVRNIAFNALPEPARQRLADILQGRSGPAPIMEQRQGKGGIVGFAILSVFGGLGLLGLLLIEFGSRSRFWQEAPFILGYITLVWMLLYGALGAFRRWKAIKSLPFAPGVYLFATDMLVAPNGDLQIYPMSALVNLRCTHHHTNGVYTQSIIEFKFAKKRINMVIRGKQQAEQKLGALNHAENQFRAAVQSGDAEAIYHQDPFFDARISPVWNDPNAAARALDEPSHGVLAAPMPKWLRYAGFIALGLASIGAPMLWGVRNVASDELAYRSISNYYSARSYVRRGVLHVDSVRQEELPRYALERAVQDGTVTALREFVAEYPNTRYTQQAYPAIHAHYERVRQEFLSQANMNDQRMVAFMTHLLAWLEANNTPSMQVRYSAPSSDALQQIDRELRRPGRRGPPITPVAPHFLPGQGEARERQLTQGLQNGFGVVFPGEILTLEGVHNTALPPDPTRPRIDVAYVVRPSGATYHNETTRQAFVGIHVDFQVTMTVPGQQPYTFPVAVEPPEHFRVRSRPGVPGGNAGLVYATMASRAFGRLGDSMANVFFRPGSPAHARAMANIQRDG